MLFGYPQEAIQENWLHECLTEMLLDLHQSLAREEEPTDWPECIPNVRRTVLRRRTGLRDRFASFKEKFVLLDVDDRACVIEELIMQNNIDRLLCAEVDCKKIGELPLGIRNEASELFTFAFKLLSDLGIRDRQYKIIYETISKKVCPFCGVELMEDPEAPRPDLDHYLVKEEYPLAAVNLKNLVPMGGRCNQKYKKRQNLLFDDAGNRRQVFYPYADQATDIIISNTDPTGNNGRPAWQVDFDPSTPESETWDAVFCVRERYKRDVLEPHFNGWLSGFSSWFRQRYEFDTVDQETLLDSLDDYVDLQRFMLHNGVDSMQPKVFQMIHTGCQEGNERLLRIIRDLVGLTGPEAAQVA